MMEIGITKGRKVATNYKTLEIFEMKIPTFSLIECKLETGRTHQIRVSFERIWEIALLVMITYKKNLQSS